MRTTLGQAKARIDISASLGIASCDARFVALLNSAQHYLADKGRWWGTYQRLYVCLSGSCITWPREVANVEGFKLCEAGVQILNQWYEFADVVCAPDRDCGCGPSLLLDRPSTPVFTDTTADRKIRLYPTVGTDAGKKIILQGTDANTGRPIRSLVAGSYITGEQLTITAPFVTSTFTYAAPGLVGVQKPLTNGTLEVFSLDPDTADEVKIAEWGPGETSPNYRRSYLTNAPTSASATCCGEGNGCTVPATCNHPVGEAIVRLEVIDAVVDSDWLLISNPLALKHGMKAIQLRDEGQYPQAEIETQEAIRILRAGNEKYSPARTMRINARPHGWAHPARVFAGFN